MKISIITACYNNEQTIRNTLQCVAGQTYADIEHLVIDGKSSDATMKIVGEFSHVAQAVSEKDNGIYDALNKGLKMAKGEVIGFLHSDDTFTSETIIEEIANYFTNSPELDGVYGNIIFVNEQGKIVRTYNSSKFKVEDFAKGKMPAHTSFFARKKVYEQFNFNTQYRIAADFDQMLRAMKSGLFTIEYRPITTTKMLVGGASTKNVKARLTINKEILQSCRENGVKTSWWKVYSKYLAKVFEFINP